MNGGIDDRRDDRLLDIVGVAVGVELVVPAVDAGDRFEKRVGIVLLRRCGRVEAVSGFRSRVDRTGGA